MSENNPLITISYEGGMQFVAENSTGCKIPIEPAVSMGGSGKIPNPVDYLVTGSGWLHRYYDDHGYFRERL